MKFLQRQHWFGAAVTVLAFTALPASGARAAEDPALSDILRRLDQLERSNSELRKENAQLKTTLDDLTVHAIAPAGGDAAAVSAVADRPGAKSAAISPGGWNVFEHKAGTNGTFFTRGGETTIYANIDVSIDAATKGLGGKLGPDGNPPVGNVGWMPDISTNMSYFGIRGFQRINGGLDFVYQFETQIDISDQSGLDDTDSAQTNVVKGGLTSRNTYIGLASPTWGAVKFGKTDAPYKRSTAMMNPFSAMLGDYQVIMGNTGGDNRVEFGTRLDHSIWYESPNWGGLSFMALYSPGQNRGAESDNVAAGEADCTGGDSAGDAGIIPAACTDGGFSDAVSASLTYAKGPLTVVAAYERHEKVNRSSDITGMYGSGNAYSQMLAAQDVADEDAAKIAFAWLFPTRTTVDVIFEHLDRYDPKDLQFQDERTRNGTWLAISQQISPALSAHFGWAHAFRAFGDPGQHNDSVNLAPGGVAGEDLDAGPHADNSADMLTTALKYKLGGGLTVYGDWAMTRNGPAAHYDLGAGGRTVTTDCHDAYTPPGGPYGSNPHCWAGGQLMGTSVGLNWQF
jgi:predicted porin